MARGAQGTAETNANNGYGQSQQFNTQLQGQNAALQNYLVPQFQSMVQNPGFDTATKSAITNQSTGAAAAAYGGASDQAARTAARTNNSAALGPLEDKLAQDKAGTMGDIGSKNQIAFAEQAKTDQQKGLQGLSGLYGMDTNLLARSLGLPPEYLQQYNNAANQRPSGFSGILQNLIGAGAQAGLGALMGKVGGGGGGGDYSGQTYYGGGGT
jgi:hypothetical protein